MKDTVLLSGIVVGMLAAALGFILPFFGIDIDMSWSKDGVLTLGEMLAFLGAILIAISEKARSTVRRAAEALGLLSKEE